MGSRDADVLICPTRFSDSLSAQKGLAFGALLELSKQGKYPPKLNISLISVIACGLNTIDVLLRRLMA